jgi:hypothetical protein
MQNIDRRVAALFICACLASPNHLFAGSPTVYEIKPSDTDPHIRQFDDPNYVVADLQDKSPAQLAVFLSGTHGKPSNARLLLHVIAEQGYRVIGLTYNDDPAVVEVCARNPSPACSGKFREKRIFGTGVASPVQNSEAESIVARLVSLIRYLAQNHPDETWGDYLLGNEPNWSRIVVSGLSQGAGMAAFIAKREKVARVVLFSSPWDYQKSSQRLAPWIAEPSATPVDRWFAEFHRRENTAALIAQAYRVLNIPPEHIRIFDRDLPKDSPIHGDNPYHPSVIRVPEYAEDWRFLYGDGHASL